MITVMNELKILTKHISCKCKYKLDGRKCDSYKIIYGTLRLYMEP